MRGLTAAALTAALLGAPGAAEAFHDPGDYVPPAIEGGGARSFFTGSPRFSGYDCSMCHLGEHDRTRLTLVSDPPELLETGRYVPGARYVVTVKLEDAARGATSSADRNSFVAEVLAAEDAPAGVLEATDDRVELVDDDRIAAPTPSFATGTTWTVAWTAPPPGTGSVWLHAAAVDGDADATPEGDAAVTAALHLAELGGVQAPITDQGYGGGCRAAPGAPPPASWIALPLLLLTLRRRSPRG